MKMSFEKFKNLASQYKVVPVYETITADLLTPVLAYIKLRRRGQHCFLLESVEGIGRLARYSFIGKNPVSIIKNNGLELTVSSNGETEKIEKNIFDFLQETIAGYNRPMLEELPDFSGGIVGYLGYENVALIEDVIEFGEKHDIGSPDSYFGIYDTIIAFDHYKHQIIFIKNITIEKGDDLQADYERAMQDIRTLKHAVRTPVEYISDFALEEQEPYEDILKDKFYELVEKCKENIFEGDVFQIVLSKRFSTRYTGDLLNVYRALRIINPSPYMYFMEFGVDITVIGTSPEDLLKVKDRKATILPIAGTRPRGADEKEDLAYEKDLMGDEKELAEHTMLVDLARNDLGRVSNYGTVEVIEKMNVHRFSHVMHIVSRVEGELQDNKDCIDALKASFPAGTVSGAPKIRAIQLLDEYERVRRNVYAGAVGYIDFGGNLDMCIAIRTLFANKGLVHWQAGAGLVADSKPENELQEIMNKSAALVKSLHYAKVIDEDSRD